MSIKGSQHDAIYAAASSMGEVLGHLLTMCDEMAIAAQLLEGAIDSIGAYIGMAGNVQPRH
jgi:hypothetical protein